MAASWRDATSTPAAGTGQRSSIARVRSKDQARKLQPRRPSPYQPEGGAAAACSHPHPCDGRPRDLFEGGLLGAVPVGATRAPRVGIVLTNDPSADAVACTTGPATGSCNPPPATPRMVLMAAPGRGSGPPASRDQTGP